MDINQFLSASCNLVHFERHAILGDASFRHYERITTPSASYILMIAPPEKENIAPFIHIAQHLTSNQFSAPNIIITDHKLGLMLIEDFGSDSYSYRAQNKNDELEIYQSAVDLLIALGKIEAPIDIANYDSMILMKEVSLFYEWYITKSCGITISRQALVDFQAIWEELLAEIYYKQNVLVLRDYHADNLMWLAQRSGIRRTGLLDFQDGLIGSPAYDLVSLLEDARRDVSPIVRDKMFKHFCDHSHFDKEMILNDYEILSAQRNIKIIGIFARLCYRDGKTHYLKFMPRVWSYLASRLESHGRFKQLHKWIKLQEIL